MSTSINRKNSLVTLLVLSLLAVPFVSTAATRASKPFSTLGICEYSRQLQDPSNRKQFLEEMNRESLNDKTSRDTVSEADQTEGSVLSFLRVTDNYAVGNSNLNQIDSFSVKCLTCHDDVSAAMGEVAIRDNPGVGKQRFRKLETNHPIGMTYDRYASNGRGFKKAAAFNKNLVFFDGKVGCLTCHNPTNPEKRHLVMSDVRSALCLSCHDK